MVRRRTAPSSNAELRGLHGNAAPRRRQRVGRRALITDASYREFVVDPRGHGTDLIDDRGFIVRRTGILRPIDTGSPIPGARRCHLGLDAYYGCFARAGFNQTFQGNGTDPTPAHAFDHEVYEWCFHGTVSALPSPLECFEWEVVMTRPARAVIFFARTSHPSGNPPVPLPWPFVLALAGCSLRAVRRLRRRGRGRGVRTALLTLALAIGSPAAEGTANKSPRRSSLRIPPVNAIPTQAYAHQFQPRGRAPSRTRWRPARRLAGYALAHRSP
jgi:hypothetical protein